MVNELIRWLGPARTRLLFGLIVAAGLFSLSMQIAFSGEDWLLTAQLAVIWVMMAGLAVILSSRLPPRGQRRLWLALGPGLLLIGIGLFVPDMILFFGGAGLGWMFVSQFVLRSGVQMEYQTAIKHLRNNEYREAIASVNNLIEAEPDDPNHRRFRAEIYRLSGDLSKAGKDYEQVIALDPDAAAGYIGLSEVYAQQGDYETARGYAVSAVEREPHQWLTAYNLGMIEDRLHHPAAAIEHLSTALKLGMSHSRYRLLTRLWMARNYYRQGQVDAAREQLALMRKQRSGLQDWAVVFASEQAAPLRHLLEADVRLAEHLLEDDSSLDALDGAPGDL